MNMADRLAVIDLGTNTFHILIAKVLSSGGFEEVFRQRQFIKLAEEGIATIGETPFNRGLSTLKDFRAVLNENQVSRVKAIGTAALRTASNGQAFIGQAKAEAGIKVELISGDEEARLIYKGVAQAVPKDLGRMLIMDIGGGSVEFIIADHEQIYWAQSFPIGVAVLYKEFHHSDPISAADIDSLDQFLEQQLHPLTIALQKFPCQSLVGASGTFDVLESLIVKQKKDPKYSQFEASLFYPIYEQLLPTTQAQRYAMESVPNSRADMIIVALILIQFTLQLANINRIAVSSYALKEGVLAEMLENHNF